MHGLDRRAGQFELPAGLERNGAAAGDVEQADDVAVLDDRFPAEQMLHAFEQRADAAAAVIGNRPASLDRERKFFVLGADAELRLRLHALREPRDQFVARFDRRHVDLVTGHEGSPWRAPAKRPRPYTGGVRLGNDGWGHDSRNRGGSSHKTRSALLRPLPSRERAAPNVQRATIG